MALKPPTEVPQGAIRLNTDSQKLEFYAQDRWHEIMTDCPVLDTGGNRGIYGGGHVPSPKESIGYFEIQTQGNSIDFGDLSQGRHMHGVGSSRTRAIWGGGGTPSKVSTIDYVTISSTGNAISFGSRTESTAEMDGLSNRTRALFAGGYSSGGNPGGYHNRIDYVTIATTGNAIDFGDLVGRRAYSLGNGGVTDGIRGWFMPGQRPDVTDQMIEVVNIASTGNAVDFGDRVTITGQCTWLFNRTTALGGSGGTTIAKWNMASGGDGTFFGNFSQNMNRSFGCNDSTRGVWGGSTSPSPSSNIMEYVTIATESDANDFGDLFQAMEGAAGTSNAHGGL